jgi:hypothetical protein
MKTKFLFAAALLISGTAFSQAVSSTNEASSRTSASTSSTKNQASATGSLSSNASASSSAKAAEKVEAASQTTSEVKESAEARVAATKTAVKNEYREVTKEAEADHHNSARVQAGSNGNVDVKHNKASSSASIDTRTSLSTKSTMESGAKSMASTKVRAKNAVNGSTCLTNSLKGKTKATAVKTGSKVSGNSGARHARMKTGVKSNISGRSALSIK